MKIPVDASGFADPELVQLMLDLPAEELERFVRLFEATEHARAPGMTPEERQAAIAEVLEMNPGLRADYEALTGVNAPCIGRTGRGRSSRR